MQFIVLVQYNFKCYYVVIYFNQWFDYKWHITQIAFS
jgi:hypothetical protein